MKRTEDAAINEAGPSKVKKNPKKKAPKKKKTPKKKATPMKKKQKKEAAAPAAKVVRSLKDLFSDA